MILAAGLFAVGCGGGGGATAGIAKQFSLVTPVVSQGISGDIYGSPNVLLFYSSKTDPQPDLVTLDNTHHQVHFWRNDGTGAFSYDAASDQNIGAGAWTMGGLIASNENMAAVGVTTTDNLYALVTDAAGVIVVGAEVRSSFSSMGFNSAQFLLFGNINNDGYGDLLLIEKSNAGVPALSATAGYTVRAYYELLNGGGSQPLVTCSENNGTAGTYITGRPAEADLDGDGDLDLVIASFASNTIHTPSPVFVVENVGGKYLSANCHTLQEFGKFGATGLHPSGVDVADINQDGYQDIVVGNFLSGGVAIYPGGGTVAGFSSSVPTLWAGGYAVNGLVATDMNNDGFVDVVAADAYAAAPKLDVYFGDGAMGFTYQALVADVAPAVTAPTSSPSFSTIEYNPGTYPINLNVVDINGDGKKDIVTANYNPVGVDQTAVPTASVSSFSIVFQK